MKVYLLRHAKSLSHEQLKRQSPDSPLGPIGEAQAKQIAERMSREKIDIIFSSPWRRASQTATYIAKKLEVPIEYFKDIVEITYSTRLFSVERSKELDQQFEKERIANISNLDWKFDKTSESKRDLIARTYKFQKYLLANCLGQTVLVVTHGIFLKAFIASCIFGKKYHDELLVSILQVLRSENVGLTLLEYVEEDRVWKINYLNNYSHPPL